MSKSDAWENSLLLHLFNNSAVSNVGDASGLPASATPGSLHVSLHTSDPGEAGSQTTNETVYTNYARQAVARSAGGWTVSGNSPTQVANTAAITFPQCGATGATITHFGVGTLLSGAGTLLYSGALTSNLTVSNGITPQFAISALVITED